LKRFFISYFMLLACLRALPSDACGILSSHPRAKAGIHATIVTAILADPKLESKGDRWFASNMLKWFSQKITVGDSVWAEFFDREARAGGWAYRSKATDQPRDLTAIEGDPQSPRPRELDRVS
jgi:hypothetical protein